MKLKCGSVLATVLLAPWSSVAGQSGFAGTWQTDVVDPPWTVALRVEGSRVTGRVSQCAGPGAVEVYDGRIDGDAVTFKCTSRDNDRTVLLTGRLTDGNIAFTWAIDVRPGGSPVAPNARARAAMFGPSAPATFTVRRVPDGPLASRLDDVMGTELAAAVDGLL
ncbi:MAG TPA: hypothetical protein VMM93_01785 [Vicinamibacterales bacterium]|nr:hypothetical protein [Vicinamibacterales bacterium]